MAKKMSKGQKKVKAVMGEYKAGTLHSGRGKKGKPGKKVGKRKQAVAIALSEARKASKGKYGKKKKK